MWASTYRLRYYIALDKKASSDGISGLDHRKMLTDSHRLVFLLIGFSCCLNLNTSQLSYKVFGCKNFASDCNIAYSVFYFITAFLVLVFVNMDFKKSLYFGYSLVFLHALHAITSFFGKGFPARIIYTSLYAIEGVHEPIIFQGCSYIISRYFSNNVYALLNSGFSFGGISLGAFQSILLIVIGSDTVSQLRKCLVLVHAMQWSVSLLGYLWLTYIYIVYGTEEDKGKNNGDENENDKSTHGRIQDLREMLSIFKLYVHRLVLLMVSVFCRYLFYPCLIPYNLELSEGSKLFIAVSDDIFSLMGRFYAVDLNEQINTTHKDPSVSHQSFLVIRDMHLIIAAFSILFACSFVIWAAWTVKFDFVRSAVSMFFFTAIHSFSYGYLMTRGLNGCLPILEYYNKQDKDNKPIVGNEFLANSNVLSDVSSGFYSLSSTVGSCLAGVLDLLMRKRRSSREYILSSSFGRLTKKSVEALLSKPGS